MSRVGLFGQISEINDHLYLSGSQVLKPEKLRQKNISCIVNATTEEPNAYLQGIDYVKVVFLLLLTRNRSVSGANRRCALVAIGLVLRRCRRPYSSEPRARL